LKQLERVAAGVAFVVVGGHDGGLSVYVES
jgi:hypothetical protein